MTKEQFYSTFEYLKQHPEEISDVLSDIRTKLSVLEGKERKQ
jgi:hypothetical protein